MLQKVKFRAVDDVREFVKAASKCEFDVDLSYDRVMVDAKSIMGVMGMDLGKSLTVTCHGEDTEFKRSIQKWAVA